MTLHPAEATEKTIRHYLTVAVSACVLLIGGVGGIAAMTELSGAVIAPGSLVVDSNVKKVQHPTGGVVAKINVREGDQVEAGSVLLQLDETVTRANLSIVDNSLDELSLRVARLEAERDNLETLNVSSLKFSKDPTDLAKLISGEHSLFQLRKEARLGQKAQLRERIAQLNEQIGGLTQQRDAKREEIKLIAKELDGIRSLWAQKLVSIERMTALEREAVRLEGEFGQLTASIAQAKGQVAEINLQIIQIDQDMRSEVAAELRDARAKIGEMTERKVAAEDALKRIDLRSPQSGVVHQLSTHTVGGVISAGEQIMLIVPVADRLTVEARVAPQDIDQVSVGQDASLHLSSFSRQTTPVLNGLVTRVSADLTTDQRTGAAYYTARIEIPADEVKKLDQLTLTPGMPVEVFLSTGERTMISYLMKPLSDQISRAFRED
ncbi:HlyD family type I secretion periplasmic adaptor subunit [Mesorhizobium sp. 1M-11]|uniref:HlyD family type I secretion periplasmic adaptor subunit n=1 Tax=Mesorhizobium sp. 1M-11 TaxID=1529006 RepID=UPI0006C74A69|nr:HlyD family type I secretion periplasmic adaptor subunit [Mesorhizobium sp. 1M-11]